MEQQQQQQYLVIALATLAFAYLLFLLLKKDRKLKLPPSPPWALPIIGHLHLLGKHPHQSLMQLARKHGSPLMLVRFGTKPYLVVSSPDVAREVLKTHDLVFASRPKTYISEIMGYQGADLIWSPYGEHWRHVRKLCTLQLLTAKRVEYFEAVRASEMSIFMRELLHSAEKSQVVNMTSKLSELTFNVMTRMVMNKSYSGDNPDEGAKEAHLFRELILEAFEVAGALHIGEFVPWLEWLDFGLPKMKEIHRRMDQFLQKQIVEHRADFREDHLKDFIDVMLSLSQAQDDEHFTDVTMKALVLDMVGAGTESSAVTVEWALAELLRNPVIMSKAQAEMETVIGMERHVTESDLPKLDYLHAILKETFRLHTPAPLLVPHESTEACQLKGYYIPAKMPVLVNAYALGRDPSVWQDALKFSPERFLNSNLDVRGQSFELLPFGSGRRSCPGLTLGMTSVLFILASLIHGFSWQTQQAEELDMAEGTAFTLQRATPLQVIPTARPGLLEKVAKSKQTIPCSS